MIATDKVSRLFAFTAFVFSGWVGLPTTARAGDDALLDPVKQLCKDYIEGFGHPNTKLYYHHRLNGPRGVAALSSPEDVAKRRVRGRPLPYGYSNQFFTSLAVLVRTESDPTRVALLEELMETQAQRALRSNVFDLRDKMLEHGGGYTHGENFNRTVILAAAARGAEGPQHKARAATGLTKVPRKSAFEVKIGLHMCGWGAKPLPDLLIAARTLSYDGVELAPVWLNKVYDISEVDGMLREHAVPLAPAVFVGADNYCDPAAVPGAVEKAETFSRWIKQRGGDYVIFSAVAGKNGRRTEEERQNVRRAYEVVGNAVRAQGCVPLYHNHYVVSHEVSREVLLEDLEDIDWNTWRLCLDTGHLVLALQDPVAVFQRWGSSVVWVHCKDVRTAEFPGINTPQAFSQMHPYFTELGCGVGS